MSTKSKMKKLTWVQQEYQELAKTREPARPVLKNCIRAFIVGGAICFVGQVISEIFIHGFGFDKKTAGDPTVAVLIFISVVLTSLGVYDKIAQWAGGGSSVPVTGSRTRCALRRLNTKARALCLVSAAIYLSWPARSSFSA